MYFKIWVHPHPHFAARRTSFQYENYGEDVSSCCPAGRFWCGQFASAVATSRKVLDLTFIEGRSKETWLALLKDVNTRVAAAASMSPDDLMITLYEAPGENNAKLGRGITASPNFLAGGGKMGALMRAKSWSGTPLGPPETWPDALKMVVSICLNSRFPISLWWGPELIMLYNDAWRPIFGKTKHPTWGDQLKMDIRS